MTMTKRFLWCFLLFSGLICNANAQDKIQITAFCTELSNRPMGMGVMIAEKDIRSAVEATNFPVPVTQSDLAEVGGELLQMISKDMGKLPPSQRMAALAASRKLMSGGYLTDDQAFTYASLCSNKLLNLYK